MTVAAISSLIGRARELGLLEARLAASDGRGGIVLIAGEPGIGKTRLTGAFAERARDAGATVLWGRCYDGAWAPAYTPWTEALVGFVGDLVSANLLTELDASAAPLLGIVPALREALPEILLPATLGAADDRLRLHDAVVRLLGAAPAARPLVLILEDLQWADEGSLALLRHVAHFLARARLLIVGTYRDVELDRDHPLVDVLSFLHRDPGCALIELGALDSAETAALVAQTAATAVSPRVAALIHGEADGNPFFVTQIVRHLADEGRGFDDDDEPDEVRGLARLGVPEGVRQVVRARVERLAHATRDLLAHAAVFSAGFRLGAVAKMTGREDRALLDGIDEALAARLIRSVDDRTETYEFTHAIIRQTLYAEWNPSRRVRLHRAAATALADVLGPRAPAHAAELTAHFYASSNLPGAGAGLAYALLAADQAMAAAAIERAVDVLKMARELAVESSPAERADVLGRLAIAQARALRFEEARQTVNDALAALLETGAAPETMADLLAVVAAELQSGGDDHLLWQPLVERGLALVADRHALTWARLMLLADPVEPIVSDTIAAGRWRGFDPNAVAVVEASGTEEDIAKTVESFPFRTLDETRAIIARARAWQQPRAILIALTAAGNDLLYRHGAFAEAAEVWRHLAKLSEQTGAIPWQEQALSQLTVLHLARGDVDEARDTFARATEALARVGPDKEPETITNELATAFAYVLDEDWPALAAFWSRSYALAGIVGADSSALAAPLYACLAALANVRAGDATMSREMLGAVTPVLARLEATGPNQNGAVAFGAAAVWDLGATELAPTYRRLAKDLIAAGVGDYPQCSNDLTLARMATLLGDATEAHEAFARAREVLMRSGQRPLRAVVDYDEASALVRDEHADDQRIRSLLDSALGAFETLGMPGWKERARGLLDRLEERERVRQQTFPAGLTEREMSVLHLIVRGNSDRQIGDTLFISPRTVHAHVRNLLSKTMTSNRTELARWALEQKLTDLTTPTDRGEPNGELSR